MTIDFTKPVQTKKGKLPALILSTNARGNYPNIGHIGDGNVLIQWDSKGQSEPKYGGDYDLENVPEKKVMYVNIYKDGSAEGYESKKDAIKNQYLDCSSRRRVEYTEGQFDE